MQRGGGGVARVCLEGWSAPPPPGGGADLPLKPPPPPSNPTPLQALPRRILTSSKQQTYSLTTDPSCHALATWNTMWAGSSNHLISDASVARLGSTPYRAGVALSNTNGMAPDFSMF